MRRHIAKRRITTQQQVPDFRLARWRTPEPPYCAPVLRTSRRTSAAFPRTACLRLLQLLARQVAVAVAVPQPEPEAQRLHPRDSKISLLMQFTDSSRMAAPGAMSCGIQSLLIFKIPRNGSLLKPLKTFRS